MKTENIENKKKQNILKDLGYYTIIFLIYILIEYIVHTLMIKYLQGKSAAYVPTGNARLGIMIVMCIVTTLLVAIFQKKDKINKQLYPIYIAIFFMIIFIPEGIIMKIITLKRNWFNIFEIILPIVIGESVCYYKKIK